jgi:hypothetical protein
MFECSVCAQWVRSCCLARNQTPRYHAARTGSTSILQSCKVVACRTELSVGVVTAQLPGFQAIGCGTDAAYFRSERRCRPSPPRPCDAFSFCPMPADRAGGALPSGPGPRDRSPSRRWWGTKDGGDPRYRFERGIRQHGLFPRSHGESKLCPRPTVTLARHLPRMSRAGARGCACRGCITKSS